MQEKEYYLTGELKSQGELLEVIDCTGRGSGRIISFDDHDSCVECIMGSVLRKTGHWKYYNKSGGVSITGDYVVLDFIGVPSKKNGLWSFYRENGSLLQQIFYDKGVITDILFFDEDDFQIL